jgi:hypothetical protein
METRRKKIVDILERIREELWLRYGDQELGNDYGRVATGRRPFEPTDLLIGTAQNSTFRISCLRDGESHAPSPFSSRYATPSILRTVDLR